MTHTIGTKGQVVIPKQLRDALKIQPGQEVVFERRGEDVLMRKAPARMPSTPLRGRFRGTALTEALLDARKADRLSEDAKDTKTDG